MFSDVSEVFVVRGHHHNPQVKCVKGRTIINCGSIGLPDDCNTTAQYLLLEQCQTGWHIRHQSVPYDLDAALARFRGSGYLDFAGPIARLFMRHVATGTAQVVPFMKFFRKWSHESDLTLGQAVDRFLNLY